MTLTKYLIKVVAILEIVGSLCGFYLLYSTLRSISYDESTFLLYLSLFSALFAVTALALVAGILLWKERRVGFALSVLVQALQIPVLTSAIFEMQLLFGVGIWPYANVDEQFHVGMRFNFGAVEDLGWRPEVPFSLGVNLLAVYFVYVLLRAMNPRDGHHGTERILGNE